MELLIGAAKPERHLLRKPYAGDPSNPSILTRHLVNSHLQPDVLERYGLPFYDLQLAYVREIKLPDFRESLVQRINETDLALNSMLARYGFPLTAARYREDMLRTLVYGEYLGVLPESSPEEAQYFKQLCGPIRPIVLPHSSRDELFDSHFVES
jgi:hypothetical protein